METPANVLVGPVAALPSVHHGEPARDARDRHLSPARGPASHRRHGRRYGHRREPFG